MAFEIKQGDTGPDYVVALTDKEEFVDLEAAASIKFLMRSAELEDPSPPDVSGLMTKEKVKIKNPKKPTEEIEVWVVTYVWQPGDTDRDAGKYNAEFEVTWNSGKVETFPAKKTEEYKEIIILEDLG